MPRFNLGRAKPGTSEDRAASEREVLKAVRATGHERLRKGRTVQLNFRITPDERREFEDLADMLSLTFTETLLDAVRYRTEVLKPKTADGK